MYSRSLIAILLVSLRGERFHFYVIGIHDSSKNIRIASTVFASVTDDAIEELHLGQVAQYDDIPTEALDRRATVAIPNPYHNPPACDNDCAEKCQAPGCSAAQDMSVSPGFHCVEHAAEHSCVHSVVSLPAGTVIHVSVPPRQQNYSKTAGTAIYPIARPIVPSR